MSYMLYKHGSVKDNFISCQQDWKHLDSAFAFSKLFLLSFYRQETFILTKTFLSIYLSENYKTFSNNSHQLSYSRIIMKVLAFKRED